MIGPIIVAILFFSMCLFSVGGIIYFFIEEDLSTKRYIKFINYLDNKE